MQALFKALKPGTAVLTVVYNDDGPECPPNIGCSANWSGYVLPKLAQAYSGITGQWTVPALASNSPQGGSSTWVGLGGNGPASLIQAGTGQDFGEDYNPFAGISYYAWYELFPASEVKIPNKSVSPGDIIKVLITPSPGAPIPVENTTGSWSIQVTNVTKKWFYSATEQYGGDLGSAEWIEEAPGNLLGATKMADYQQVEFNFYDQVASGGGSLAPVKLSPSQELWLNQDGASGIFSTPSSPSGDQRGFYVTWTTGSANQVAPPGPWIQTTSLPPAVLGQPYSQTLVVNEATSPVWTFNGAVPNGMQFNKNAGVLSGTPTIPTNYNFSVFATDTSDGSYTATVPLTLSVKGTPYASLQVNCIEFGQAPPTAIKVAVSGSGVSNLPVTCSTPIQLPVGVYSLVGTPTGATGPFKVNYIGACNASGKVTLTQSEAANCTVSAETEKAFENACPSGQHCCEASATGCLKCTLTKYACQ